VGNVELLFSELAGLGKEQANEDVTVANSLVALVLQAGFGHGVKKIFRSNYF
jgi:hypothetical protein